ncbi:MAG: hypothetical protein B6U65_01440 [Candidatus Wolframiiraptor sp. EX4484-121]|nr:MAG: hypothetical protein B6U65_01440 [Candidatus Wolframiiraptor sp. EX4484-121]
MRGLSRIPIRMMFEGVGEYDGEFIRFYAPITVQQLLKLLPIEGAAAKWDYAIYFQIDLRRGAEREVKRVKAGDILYWPPSRYLVVAYKDAIPPAQMVKVGELRGDLSRLEDLKPGAKVRITRLE